MSYDRNPRGTTPGDTYNRGEQDYGQDYGSGRDNSYSSAREYQAAGQFDRDDRGGYGRDQGGRGQGGWNRPEYGGGSAQGNQQYGQSRGGQDRPSYGARQYGEQGFGSQNRSRDDRHGGQRSGQAYGGQGRGDDGRAPQGYDDDDRGFLQRAGDEVRSWFGDDDAERRRDMDARHDERHSGDRHPHDRDYHSWRSTQISQLDRDYDEYRRENRSKFENEFNTWRTGRQGQRDLLGKVEEHMDVVGSDGTHVGTVDKVRGDRILLTKTDKDAGGHHHSIPSSWLKTVDTKVTLTKSADEAKSHWRDEERNLAMFNDERERDGATGRDAQGRLLNRSFSGTY